MKNNAKTIDKLRSLGHNKSVDIFSFRSHETDVPVKNPENIAKYGPTKSEKRVKFMDSKKEKIFDKLE